MNRRLRGLLAGLLLMAGALVLVSAVQARVGGGHSYSGGHSSSGGGHSSGGGGHSGGSHSSNGGSSGDITDLIFLLVRLVELHVESPLLALLLDSLIVGGITLVYFFKNGPVSSSATPPVPRDVRTREAALEVLRHHDPNFSEGLFLDFAYALFVHVHEARGKNQLPAFAPYLQPRVLAQLQGLGGPDLHGVRGVIVAAARIASVSDADHGRVVLSVDFDANYTETSGPASHDTTWYTSETWTFSRKLDLLSRPPEKITALHCPRCGGALEQNADGSCKQCGVRVVAGALDWSVSAVRVRERVDQGPVLTADVPEVGTDFPTVFQPSFDAARRRFLALNPDLLWPALEGRVRYIFLQLQQAWTDGQWEKARPFVSDCLFQSQLYWISEYKRQALRNVLEDVHIDRVQPVKIAPDPFYDVVTFRIYAAMVDYTADATGKVVSGNKSGPRRFTEYWTFIRRRGVKSGGKDNANCPNCGAALKVNMAGVCAYCQGKITSGDFDWVVSRIEQDEGYDG